MKRGFLRRAGTAVAALCLLLVVATAEAADAKTARLLYVSNESWSADAIASNASAGATLRTTDCNGIGFPGDTITFEAGGEAVVSNFAKLQCNAKSLFGIVELPYSGSIELATEATYRDAKGNFNFVYIPALTDAQKLPAASHARLTLSRVSSKAGERSTYLAIVGSSWLTINLYLGSNPFLVVGTEVVYATGATWYEIKTELPIGRAEITRGVAGVGFPGADEGGDVYVVGFVGKREGGSPRVELPTLTAAP
jgi:hypothetical protein